MTVYEQIAIEAHRRRRRAVALCWEAARFLLVRADASVLLAEIGGLLHEAAVLDGGGCDA